MPPPATVAWSKWSLKAASGLLTRLLGARVALDSLQPSGGFEDTFTEVRLSLSLSKREMAGSYGSAARLAFLRLVASDLADALSVDAWRLCARDFELSPPLARAFKSGLVEAATSSRGWIVTGGTDTGVMKLVGDACLESHLSVPVIGIAPCAASRGERRGAAGEHPPPSHGAAL